MDTAEITLPVAREKLRRLTVDDYHQMGDAGVFGPEERVELLDGEIFTMSPIGPFHGDIIDSLTDYFAVRAKKRWRTRVQSSLRVSRTSEPEPDLILLKPGILRYRGRLPAADDTFLLIEVADTSLEFDLTVKVPIYARTGISEVWVVDLNQESIRIFRNPQNGRYTSETTAADFATPLAFPDLKLNIRALFEGSDQD